MKHPAVLFLIILAASCARMIAPGGGPEDETPPEIVLVDPPPGPGYSDLSRIRIDWSERLDESSVNVSVYPGQEYSIEVHGKTIEVILDTPVGETPLVLQLSPDIADRRRNRSGVSLSFAYCSGDSLPGGLMVVSLTRQGRGNISGRTLVEVYSDSSDDSTDDIPLIRRVDVDSTGRAEVAWLEPARYRILCYEDPDFSHDWNSQLEAGIDTTLVLCDHDTLQLRAVLTVIDTIGPVLTDVAAIDRFHAEIIFGEEVSYESFGAGSVTLEDTSGSTIAVHGYWLPGGFSGKSVIIETDPLPDGEILILTRDIQDLMNNPALPDSLIFTGTDSLPLDSLRLRSYFPAPLSVSVDPAGPYNVSFNFFVHMDSLESRLSLIRISDSTAALIELTRVDGRTFEMVPLHQLIGEQQYRFSLLPGLCTAWGDTLPDVFSWSFSTMWGDEPGNVEGYIRGTVYGTVILQISRTGGDSDNSVILAPVAAGSFAVENISAGRYTVAAFIDLDGSGTWSPMEPYGTYPGVVLVQPGLPTKDVDIEILP